jgi:hypothetical protein
VRTLRRGLGAAALGVLAVIGSQVLALPAAQATEPDVTKDRTLRDERITESSGLAASRRTPGVVWTHNDSGNPPVLYAVGPSGATVGTARVRGVGNVDWEALAPVTGRGGSRLLAIGDLGDNSAARSRIEIDLVPEPSTAGSSRIAPVRVLRLRYPDGPTDAEALLADPRDGRLYVVTKGLLTSTIYAVPTSAWPGAAGTPRSVTATLEPVGRVNLTLVTDGAMLPDGRILLRTYGMLAVLAPLSMTTGSTEGSGSAGTPTDVPTLFPLATMALPPQNQGEGMAVLDAGTGRLLLSSEGAHAPFLRLAVPKDVWKVGATAAGTSAGGTPPPVAPGGVAGAGSGSKGMLSAAGESAGRTGDGGQAGSGAWLITVAGAAAFAILLLIARRTGRRSHPL